MSASHPGLSLLYQIQRPITHQLLQRQSFCSRMERRLRKIWGPVRYVGPGPWTLLPVRFTVWWRMMHEIILRRTRKIAFQNAEPRNSWTAVRPCQNGLVLWAQWWSPSV